LFKYESNLTDYSGKGSAFKPGSVHRKSNARIPERIKEFMDKTSRLIFGLITVVTENMQWKEN